MLPDWRIFYSDGSTFDSTMGAEQDAPSRGFICCVGFREGGGRYITAGMEWYTFDSDSREWWGFRTLDGLIDYLCEHNGCAGFAQGRTVRDTVFSDLMTAADRDPDFPREGR